MELENLILSEMSQKDKDKYHMISHNWNLISSTNEHLLRKPNMELPFDPAIPLLGIYPEKTVTHKDTCTHMFIAALFTIARTWKQPKCPSRDDWIWKMWYIYTMEYYSAIKRMT